MPVLERASMASRMFARVFRSPIVRWGALAVGLGAGAAGCVNHDKVMDLSDDVKNGGWVLVAEKYARDQLGLAAPSSDLVTRLTECLSGANGGRSPIDSISGESGKQTIYPPDAGCVGRAILATQAGESPVVVPVAAASTEAPVLQPAALGPLPPINITVATLLRKGNKITPITITLPEGFTVNTADLGTIYVPMEQEVDLALVRVEDATAPVLAGQVLTGFGLKPGTRFKWNAGLPLEASFQIQGTRTQAATAENCGAVENGAPQILALGITAFEAVENNGGGHGDGTGGGTGTTAPSLTPPAGIRETIMNIGSNGNQ